MGKLGLGPFGMALNVSDTYLDQAAELERLGYSAVWLPGGQIDNLGRLADLVGATTAVAVGSAIISLDVYPPETVTGLYEQLEATAPGRLVAGLGGPQSPRPLQVLNAYLDHLDRAVPPLPARRRLLAALGPRKLGLARDRCAGAILLLVTPAYIGMARQPSHRWRWRRWHGRRRRLLTAAPSPCRCRPCPGAASVRVRSGSARL